MPIYSSFSHVDGDEGVAKATEVMQPIADEFKKSPEASRLFFFVANVGGDVSKHFVYFFDLIKCGIQIRFFSLLCYLFYFILFYFILFYFILFYFSFFLFFYFYFYFYFILFLFLFWYRFIYIILA